LLDKITPGAAVTVTGLDRLARSTRHVGMERIVRNSIHA
jgi:DNA invertase Pin-like site-specific DNA recombinase